KTEARPGTLEENYEKIKDNLFQQKMELEYPIWLGEQYQKYPVENFLT
ncbi:MAG TPA: foldase, partial [Syntrophomonas sp.]|nr:foldase [Syntrophomonas sp.]